MVEVLIEGVLVRSLHGGKILCFQTFGQRKAAPPQVWRRMCQVHSKTEPLLLWTFGKGDVSFWWNNWLGEECLQVLLKRRGCGWSRTTFGWMDGWWDVTQLNTFLPSSFMELVAKCRLAWVREIDYGGKAQWMAGS